MISSPGCQCLMAGASGAISTRFWITSRPGHAEILTLEIGAGQPRNLLLYGHGFIPSLGDTCLRGCRCRLAVRGEEFGQRSQQLIGSLLRDPVATPAKHDAVDVVRDE